MLKIQRRVKALYKKKGWKTAPTLLILALQEELGEVAKRWLRESKGYEKLSSAKADSTLFEEIGDLGNLLLALCNALGIDFEKAVENTVEKVLEKRRE